MQQVRWRDAIEKTKGSAEHVESYRKFLFVFQCLFSGFVAIRKTVAQWSAQTDLFGMARSLHEYIYHQSEC